MVGALTQKTLVGTLLAISIAFSGRIEHVALSFLQVDHLKLIFKFIYFGMKILEIVHDG